MRTKGGLGTKPQENFSKPRPLLYYKCDQRPFLHNSGTRKETKICRILCLIKGIHLVISLKIISTRGKESVLTCKQEFGKNGMELNVIDFRIAPYIKLHSLTL